MHLRPTAQRLHGCKDNPNNTREFGWLICRLASLGRLVAALGGGMPLLALLQLPLWLASLLPSLAELAGLWVVVGGLVSGPVGWWVWVVLVGWRVGLCGLAGVIGVCGLIGGSIGLRTGGVGICVQVGWLVAWWLKWLVS